MKRLLHEADGFREVQDRRHEARVREREERTTTIEAPLSYDGSNHRLKELRQTPEKR